MSVRTLPPLDPAQEYTDEQLAPYPTSIVQQFLREKEDLELERTSSRVDKLRNRNMETERIERPTLQLDLEPMEDDLPRPTYPRAIGPALPPTIVNRRLRQTLTTKAGTKRDLDKVRLAGDKKDLIVGYKQNSLCNMLTDDAFERIKLAMTMLDQEHADIIEARLRRAGIKNANASRADLRAIPFKKMVSIALQAETWVYQAQAAAAKHMVKESKRCLHYMAGKRKRTTEEKAELYRRRYGMERGTKGERAARKYQKRINSLKGNVPAPQ